MRPAAKPPSPPFWAGKERAPRPKPWSRRRPLTLICSTRRPIFCGQQPALWWPERLDLSRPLESSVTASSKTPLLDRVHDAADLRGLPREQLNQLAAELRQETVDVVSLTGGHLGAGLGVVELTVALHRVFDTPRDRLIWDVGHQS